MLKGPGESNKPAKGEYNLLLRFEYRKTRMSMADKGLLDVIPEKPSDCCPKARSRIMRDSMSSAWPDAPALPCQ
jgi:hypothetical protein